MNGNNNFNNWNNMNNMNNNMNMNIYNSMNMNNNMNNNMNIYNSMNMNNMNNMINNNNMGMNNMINNNMGMNALNNPMQMQINMMLQNFYNQMLQLQTMKFNNQMNMMQYSVKNDEKPTDRLPTNYQNVTTDPFANHPGQRANLIFQTAKGFKVTIIAPLDVTVLEVLVEYIKKVGLGPAALYDGFVFLFNGAKINLNDKNKLVKELISLGNVQQNHVVIVVVDTKNLIGS